MPHIHPSNLYIACTNADLQLAASPMFCLRTFSAATEVCSASALVEQAGRARELPCFRHSPQPVMERS